MCFIYYRMVLGFSKLPPKCYTIFLPYLHTLKTTKNTHKLLMQACLKKIMYSLYPCTLLIEEDDIVHLPRH